MTPFWLPPVVAVACAILYITTGDAGRGAKLTVAGLVVQVCVAGYVIYWLRAPG